jgi:hypothetical protein
MESIEHRLARIDDPAVRVLGKGPLEPWLVGRLYQQRPKLNKLNLQMEFPLQGGLTCFQMVAGMAQLTCS